MVEFIFKYFSQFVPKSTLDDIFSNRRNPAQRYWLDAMKKLPDENRIPTISDFVFSINEDAVVKRLSSITGKYLFVEYGRINSGVNPAVDVKTDSMRISITVAQPMPDSSSMIDEAIAQQSTLEDVGKIARVLRQDSQLALAGKYEIGFPTSFEPFVSATFAHSIGWTFQFDLKGVDVV